MGLKNESDKRREREINRGTEHNLGSGRSYRASLACEERHSTAGAQTGRTGGGSEGRSVRVKLFIQLAASTDYSNVYLHRSRTH